MGESQAFSSDLMTQAQKLISKLKRTLGEETNEKWKAWFRWIRIFKTEFDEDSWVIFQLIFVLAGQNDLCRLSCNTNSTDPFPTDVQTPTQFATNVKLALEKLIEELPRTFVALVLPPGMKIRVPGLILVSFLPSDRSFGHDGSLQPSTGLPHDLKVDVSLRRRTLLHRTTGNEAKSATLPGSLNKYGELLKTCYTVIETWPLHMSSQVGTSHVNDRFEDFAVVIQPGLEDLALPRTYANFFGVRQDFLPDMSFLAPDCFHPSQKLHALSKNFNGVSRHGLKLLKIKVVDLYSCQSDVEQLTRARRPQVDLESSQSIIVSDQK